MPRLKLITSIVIFSILLSFTSLIKNSTKNINVKIYDLKEDIRLLNEKYELVLLDHNFSLSHKDDRGWTPLFWAVFYRRTKMVTLLLKLEPQLLN